MKVYDYYISPKEYEIAAKNGISRRLVNTRVRDLAWNKERAITEPIKKGSKYKEWIRLAETNGISKERFYGRKREGWTLEDAATVPIMSKEEIINKIRKYKKEHLDLIKKNGIEYDTFRMRINKLGWNPIIAATIKPQRNVCRGVNENEIK